MGATVPAAFRAGYAKPLRNSSKEWLMPKNEQFYKKNLSRINLISS
jgi:hypothetical protein